LSMRMQPKQTPHKVLIEAMDEMDRVDDGTLERIVGGQIPPPPPPSGPIPIPYPNLLKFGFEITRRPR